MGFFMSSSRKDVRTSRLISRKSPASMAEAVSAAPSITPEDLANFHMTHFSTTSINHFAYHFLAPAEVEVYPEEVEDDGLGYYEDGAKRTLTDEQIAIFRHSEIQALFRDRRHAVEAREDGSESPAITPVDLDKVGEMERTCVEDVQPLAEAVDLGDGELSEDISILQTSTPRPTHDEGRTKNKRKNKNKNGKKGQRPPQTKGFFRQNVKPDLRKRTWDIVDAGLGNLDYDEGNGGSSDLSHVTQRRRISYDED